MDVWKQGFLKLFFSHTSAHKVFAGTLRDLLQTYGISAFVAHSDIEPTLEWQGVIEFALRTCDAFGALLTADFPGSKWTDQEVGFAYGQDKLMIPIRLEIDPYGFIGKYQGLSISNFDEKFIAEGLFKVLLGHEKTQLKMSEGLVSAFEESHSFQDAKDRMSRLEQLKTFNKELASRLYVAIEENPQIKGSWGVPDRVNRLMDKFGITEIEVPF